jgi:hypothetical protein
MPLGKVYNLLCCDKGISIADMGLVCSVRVREGMTRLVLLLPSGWSAIAANLLAQVEDQIVRRPGTQMRPYPAKGQRWPSPT